MTVRNDPAWLDGLFTSIDGKDTESFLGFLTGEAVFQFGSVPAVQGTENIRAAVDGFFGTIKGSTHALSKTLADGSVLVCEGTVTYQRMDDSELTLPFTNVFELDGNLISHYKIYIDIAPLYAE